MKDEDWVRRELRRDSQTARRMRLHKNPFKIKSHLIETEVKNNPFQYARYGISDRDLILKRDWDNPVRYCYFRPIRTYAEARTNVGHADEYGPGIVRWKRTGRLLPDAWWDLPNGSWATDKSWKHNSKRRKQWKRYSVFESHT